MSTPLPLLSSNAAHQISLQFCAGSQALGKSCAWYHSNWNLLRRLGLVSNPFWHEQFYADCLRRVVCNNTGPIYILISGGADDGMLTCILRNIPHQRVHITMIDTCPTPLIISQITAFKEKIAFTPIQCYAEKLPFKDKQFHVVITDAFLTRFSHPLRQHIADEWKRVLTERGRIITTARVMNNYQGQYHSSIIDTFRFGMLAAAKATLTGTNPLSTFQVAFTYARRMISNPFHDSAEIVELFKDCKRPRTFSPQNLFREVEEKSYIYIEVER